VQTGARILPDERPLPAELVAFLDVAMTRATRQLIILTSP
jgi:hypothetical protein